MKKFISAVLFAASLLILFAGCAAEEVPETVLAEYVSPAGYTVSYPAELTPSALSSDIDFVLLDTNTATNVSIATLDKLSSFEELTEEWLVAKLAKDSMEVELSSFERTTINETDAIIAQYSYKGSNITNVIYNAPERMYSASYTEFPGTSEKLRKDFTAIIYSLKA